MNKQKNALCFDLLIGALPHGCSMERCSALLFLDFFWKANIAYPALEGIGKETIFVGLPEISRFSTQPRRKTWRK